VIRSQHRDKLQKYLAQRGISTVIHYPIPPHRQECYLSFKNQPLPIADKLAGEVLSLPISPMLNKGEIDFICNSIIDFQKEAMC
jgi:dTDP-4-amino-4,6-dideoxygalactose transaminase